MFTNIDQGIVDELRKTCKHKHVVNLIKEAIALLVLAFVFYLAFYGTYAIESEWSKLIERMK